MDLLTLYGLVAVGLMLIFYAVEDRSPWFVLAFAGSCVMASSYGFLQGAWPQGQRQLSRCSGKDFQQEVVVPGTATASADDAVFTGMLLQ